MNIPQSVKTALDLLGRAGFESFVVGGCVRDALLCKEPNDWDITTIALPEETKNVFKDYRVIETGIKHGTVAVIIDDVLLEITTYRIDGDYEDNRHPQDVTFTRNLSEDLKRRDFTINALVANANGEVKDLVGGKADLENKLIRCVGEPDQRFKEDALRILRALRFSATLDFDIEAETGESIKKNAMLLENISAERVTEELSKLLCGVGERVIKILIEYRDVFAIIIPELKPCFDFDQKNIHHVYDVYEHIAHSVGTSEPILDVRLALLLHDIAKPDCFFVDENGVGHAYGHADKSAEYADKILKRLKVSNELYTSVWTLVKYHDYPVEPNLKIVRRRLCKFGPELFEKLIYVKMGDNWAHNLETGNYDDMLKEILALSKEAENTCFSTRTLDITGDDLINLGVEKGPEIGKILNLLLEEVMDEKLENEKEILIRRVKELGTEEA